ncbi:unnamed protein product [Caenorhabditis brenneri]
MASSSVKTEDSTNLYENFGVSRETPGKRIRAVLFLIPLSPPPPLNRNFGFQFLQITSSWQQRKPKQSEREWLGFRREEQHRYIQWNQGISMEKTQLFHNFLIRNQLNGAKNKQPYKAEMNAWRSDWKSAMKSTLLSPLFERFMLHQNNYDLEFVKKAEKHGLGRETKANRALRATEIYAVYLSHQAPKRVNVLDATRDEVKSFFSKNCRPRMFKAAKTEVSKRVHEQ